MTNVIFSFDTEDIINEHGADGILRCANILREEGIRGCFNIIGLLPDVLKSWGRDDIFEALKYHEIDFHSHAHSIHPTINEYTDKENYYEALAKFISDERAGMEKVQIAFERKSLPAACIPGNCTSYVAHYGYEQLGFKFFSGDDIYDKVNYRPVYNCNTISLHYARALDGVLFRVKNQAEIDDFINQTARGKDTMVFFHHPQRAYCKSFWDGDNFNKKNTPKESWIKSEIHDTEDTERFYKNFRALACALRDDPSFHILTYSELAEKIQEEERIITPSDLSNIREQLDNGFFPVTAPSSYCIADIFQACCSFLLGKDKHICGKVYGFLSEPYASSNSFTISRADAIKIAEEINFNDFLPEKFNTQNSTVGPRELLDAMLAFLIDGIDVYTVTPNKPWQIDLNQFPTLRDLNYKGSWIHADTLNDDYLSNRLRYQSWTIRLPAHTKRFIFN